MLDRITAVLAVVFNRRTRAALYALAAAFLAAKIADGTLPPWTAAPGSGLLLALLNLTPEDAETYDEPDDRPHDFDGEL